MDARGLGPGQSIGDSTRAASGHDQAEARAVVAETRVEMLRSEITDLRASRLRLAKALLLTRESVTFPDTIAEAERIVREEG